MLKTRDNLRRFQCQERIGIRVLEGLEVDAGRRVGRDAGSVRNEEGGLHHDHCLNLQVRCAPAAACYESSAMAK